ncbi:MAG: hypothetical protein K8T26_10200 [Lentisphaerae bacterium]|nr:hypothetical protein [Lentisphaerota bacterium]
MWTSKTAGLAVGAWLIARLAAGSTQASVSWEAPRFNIDGSTVTNLACFKVYYGTESGNYPHLQIVTSSPAVIANLENNQRYYFAVSAVSGDGLESARSDEHSWQTPPATKAAQLALSTQVVTVVVTQGESTPSNRVEIWNAGDGTLAYTISGLPDWYACTPSSGTSTGEHDVITFRGVSDRLTPGCYTTSVVVTAQETGAAPQSQQLQIALTLNGRYYRDADGDGFGYGQPVLDVRAPAGYVATTGDRDDLNAAIHPGATESNNGLDDDCDGQIDENFIPVAMLDFDGDVRADMVVFEPATGLWRVHGSDGRQTQLAFGYNGTMPLAEDFDGDLVSDYAVFVPAEGRWYLTSSATGGVTTVLLGDATSVPVPADYDGDGRADAAVFNPATRMWSGRMSANGTTRSGKFGGKGAIPVPADYDGDGLADVAVYEPAKAMWSGIRSRDGKFISGRFGARNALPVPADYDGDGLADAASYEPATGTWSIQESTSHRIVEKAFGWSGTIPVPGDYDGDGVADLCLYEPATGQWHTRLSSGGETRQAWGSAESQPVLPQYQINRRLGLCL